MASLFSKKTPAIEPPAPLPDEEATGAARKRRIAKETKTSGVGSTILSSGGRETLGA